MSAPAIVAPSDAQLALIARLVREQGWTAPAAIHSKAEASEIISAMLASTYRPEQYEPARDEYGDVPF